MFRRIRTGSGRLAPAANRLPFLLSAIGAISLACVGSTAAFPQERQLSEADIEACSALGVVVANAEAWVRGDVLLEISDTFDNVKPGDGTAAESIHGVAYSKRRYHRFRFDQESGQFLHAWRESMNGVSLPVGQQAKPIDTVQVGATLFSVPEKRVWTFYDQRGFQSSRLRDLSDQENLLKQWNIGDVRCIWAEPQRGILFSRSPRAARLWREKKAGDGFASAAVDSNGNRVLDFLKLVNDGHRSGTRIVLHADHLMPVEITDSNVSAGSVSSRPSGSATLDWEQKGEVYVPRLIRISRPEINQVDGVRQIGRLEQEVKLHWFGINQPLDPGAFDHRLIANSESIVRLLDPAASKVEPPLQPTKNSSEEKK